MAIAQENGAATDTDAWTKPPFLRRVRIEGYKSIAFCDVALQPLTILVGRNASGKSNILDALAFLRDALAKGTEEAVQRHGGRNAILYRPGQSSIVSFSVTVGFPLPIIQSFSLADYSVKIHLPEKTRPTILSERVRIKDTPEGNAYGYDRESDRVMWVGYPEGLSYPILDSYNPDRSVLSLFGNPNPYFHLRLGLEETGFYNFSPEVIRTPQRPTYGIRLEQDGRNIASVIESLREIGGETIDRVSAYLSAIVSEIEGFEVVHYGEYETIKFRLHSGTKGKPLEFDAASMSDGTLRALAALVAAFQGQLPFGPSVVGIEEPETALHPAAMRALVDALEEATGHTQILLTTHSADLLADRDLHPSQVLVVRNRDGQTLITPVDAASREIIAKELDTLADLHRQDHLDLDETDLQRQAAERAREGGA